MKTFLSPIEVVAMVAAALPAYAQSITAQRQPIRDNAPGTGGTRRGFRTARDRLRPEGSHLPPSRLPIQGDAVGDRSDSLLAKFRVPACSSTGEKVAQVCLRRDDEEGN